MVKFRARLIILDIVGETGGKNMHFVHKSADPINVVHQTIRSSFEYQGEFAAFSLFQDCEALTTIFRPKMLCVLSLVRSLEPLAHNQGQAH